MKVGDLVQMVTGQPDYKSSSCNNGIVIELQRLSCPTIHEGIATVMLTSGEIVSWPLDSHYEIRVISEAG